MIDWHSHILPAMDDGSRDVEESIALLQQLKEQGVDTVVATPHFYANDESVETFLERRKRSYEQLIPYLSEELPRIVLGAEVRYYPGISRMEHLKQLRIEGSKLLLLEMPFSKWTEYTVRELMELSGAGSTKPVLAHVERYLSMQSGKIREQLCGCGILMQVNASFFCEMKSRRLALKFLSSGKVQFVGSDCHNLTTRPPHMDRAYEIIRKKIPENFITRMNEHGRSLLVHK